AFGRIAGYDDFLIGQPCKQGGGRAVILRGGDPELETEPFGGPDPGVCNVVVAVADKADFQVIQRLSPFEDGEQIRQNLAGMLGVREGINRRDPAIVSESLNIGLCKGPDHCSVKQAPKHSRGVDDRLTSSKLNVAGGKENYTASHFPDPNLKTDAGPSRRLAEQHGPGLACQEALR